jgi:ferrous iron transport protein B
VTLPDSFNDECPKSIALIGNPNCGKTTLFNALTGARYKVANYPGVTVEKREGSILFNDTTCARLFDLPGTYALCGTTLDEKIVTQFLHGELPGCSKPDLIIAVVDATNLERNLFLVSELIDAGYPLLLAVNMIDSAKELGLSVYCELLAKELDMPVIPLSARSKIGISALIEAAHHQLAKGTASKRTLAWLPESSEKHAHLAQLATSIKPRDPDSVTAIGSLRYAWIRSVVSRTTKHSANPHSYRASRLDSVLTSKIWGLPIMLSVFWLVFQAVFLWAQAPMEIISTAVDASSAWLASLLPAGLLTNLLTQGVVPGVGNVIIFIPQIAILFFFIGILEDSGYLSRAAFLLDNFMRKVGLQGRAFVPLLSSFACAVPGILSTRTIPSRSDRLATIMIAPLMSCSARLPVYAVLIAAFIPATLIGGFISLQGLTLLGMYLLGVIGACGVAWILKKTLLWKEQSFYVMEMPPLRRPILKVVLRSVYDSVISFLKNATTIILACSIVIWFLATYPKPPQDFDGPAIKASFAGQLGIAIEPAIKPLGFNWEIGIGILSSFPAREVFVTALTTVYNVGDDDDEHQSLIKNLQERHAAGLFPTATALSLMVFYVFACQCMSTLAVCKRETGSWAWTIGMFSYMTALAYLASFVTFRLGSMWL